MRMTGRQAHIGHQGHQWQQLENCITPFGSHHHDCHHDQHIFFAGFGPALRISFDDISLCNCRVILKISLKYQYRIFF